MECGKTKGRREEERKRKAEELEWKRRKKKGLMGELFGNDDHVE